MFDVQNSTCPGVQVRAITSVCGPICLHTSAVSTV